MPAIASVLEALEVIAPLSLAADWDTVGLLVGQPATRDVTRVMTCLTLSPTVAAEAARERVDLVVTHHPLPFRPVARLTAATMTGRSLLTLLPAGIAVYSPHTAWDSAAGGINDQLAGMLDLSRVRPIRPAPSLPDCGEGRLGIAPGRMTVGDVAAILSGRLGATGCHVVGEASRPADRVAIVCGSGGDLLEAAAAAGGRTFVTGELRLHAAEEARSADLAVVAVGHHASECFAMEALGRRLGEAVSGLTVFASRVDRDPFAWVAVDSGGRRCT